MYSEMVIRTTDILDEVEELVIAWPDLSYDDYDKIDKSGKPFWFDSENAWSWLDFTDPELYKSVEVIFR